MKERSTFGICIPAEKAGNNACEANTLSPWLPDTHSHGQRVTTSRTLVPLNYIRFHGMASSELCLRVMLGAGTKAICVTHVSPAERSTREARLKAHLRWPVLTEEAWDYAERLYVIRSSATDFFFLNKRKIFVYLHSLDSDISRILIFQ